jgi:hypothetical protein
LRAGLLAYVTYGPQSVGTVNGLPVRPGLLLSVASGMDVRKELLTGDWQRNKYHWVRVGYNRTF